MRVGRRTAAILLIVVGGLVGLFVGLSLVLESAGNGDTQYAVTTVRFNRSVTQDEIDQVGALLRTFDNEVDFLIMETFPPIGRAVLTTDASDFCQTVVAELEAESYVDEVSCQPWQEVDEADPDAPVTDKGSGSGESP